MSRRYATVLTLIFLLSLLASAAGLIFPATGPAPFENRMLAKVPAVPSTVDELKKFPSGLDQFSSDHFSLRPALLSFYRTLVGRWWGESLSKDVVVGQNGWLFYVALGGLDDIVGRRTVSEASMAKWDAAIAARGEWLARKSISYAFSVLPDKQQIFHDDLPAGLWRGKPGRVEEFEASLSPAARAYYLPVLGALRNASAVPDLYFHSDSHWSPAGAYVAYREMVASAGSRLKLTDWKFKMEEFRRSDVKRDGDLSTMSGLVSTDVELVTPAVPVSCDVPADPERTQVAKDFRSGVTVSCGGVGTALVLHDSFMHLLSPFIAPNYRTTYLVEGDGANLAELVDLLKPDVVIQQRIERGLTLPSFVPY